MEAPNVSGTAGPQGSLQKPTFYNFRTEECKSATMARKWLATHGVGHYWDMAMSVHTDEAGVSGM